MPEQNRGFCLSLRGLLPLAAAMIICQFCPETRVCPETRGDDVLQYVNRHTDTGMSDAVVVDDLPLVHTAQILPLKTDGALAQTDIASQTAAVLDGLQVALRSGGSSLNLTIKLNFYVTDVAGAHDVAGFLAAQFCGDHQPAVSFVVTALPLEGALVAADAVAVCRGESPGAVDPQLTGAVVPAGSRIYVAGQAEQSPSLAEATRKTLESLRATLQFLGREIDDTVQLKAFLMPMQQAGTVQQEVERFFAPRRAPPLVLVEWKSSDTTPVEIELIAWGGQGAPDAPAVEYLTPPGMTVSPVYSRVARISRTRTIYVSGLYAASADPATMNEPAAGEREVREVFAALHNALKPANSDFQHLVKATYYVSTSAASRKLNELRPLYYNPARPPSASKAEVTGVGRKGVGLTLDMIAVPAGSHYGAAAPAPRDTSRR